VERSKTSSLRLLLAIGFASPSRTAKVEPRPRDLSGFEKDFGICWLHAVSRMANLIWQSCQPRAGTLPSNC